MGAGWVGGTRVPWGWAELRRQASGKRAQNQTLPDTIARGSGGVGGGSALPTAGSRQGRAGCGSRRTAWKRQTCEDSGRSGAAGVGGGVPEAAVVDTDVVVRQAHGLHGRGEAPAAVGSSVVTARPADAGGGWRGRGPGRAPHGNSVACIRVLCNLKTGLKTKSVHSKRTRNSTSADDLGDPWVQPPSQPRVPPAPLVRHPANHEVPLPQRGHRLCAQHC